MSASTGNTGRRTDAKRLWDRIADLDAAIDHIDRTIAELNQGRIDRHKVIPALVLSKIHLDEHRPVLVAAVAEAERKRPVVPERQVRSGKVIPFPGKDRAAAGVNINFARK